LAGVAALAVAIWYIALFAPRYPQVCPHSRYTICPNLPWMSLVDYQWGGLNRWVSVFPDATRFIVAFLLVAGVVALGAVLHGGLRVGAARWLVWGGTVLLALLLPNAASLLALFFDITMVPVRSLWPVSPLSAFSIINGYLAAFVPALCI